ncbi:hypothetical protein [Pedobacter panaciterrae]
MDNKSSLCENCGKPLAGRTDKRFCHDGCKNTFSRVKKQAEQVAEHENLPEIFRIIKRNYELINTSNLPKENEEFLYYDDMSGLLAQGFKSKSFTSVFTDENVKTWHCIFDVGFHLDGKFMEVGWLPKQVEIT